MSIQVTPVEGGIRMGVQVQPRASRNQIIGEQDGCLKVKLTAPPVEGEANQALVIFLARLLAIPKKNIKLLKGETSRHKLIEISGLSGAELLDKLNL